MSARRGPPRSRAATARTRSSPSSWPSRSAPTEVATSAAKVARRRSPPGRCSRVPPRRHDEAPCASCARSTSRPTTPPRDARWPTSRGPMTPPRRGRADRTPARRRRPSSCSTSSPPSSAPTARSTTRSTSANGSSLQHVQHRRDRLGRRRRRDRTAPSTARAATTSTRARGRHAPSWLLDRKLSQRPAGRAAPASTWASTQHNIIAWFLAHARSTDDLPRASTTSTVEKRRRRHGDGDRARPARHRRRASRCAFNQGCRRRDAPARRPDARRCSCLRRRARAQPQRRHARSAKVYDYLVRAFPVSGRSITKSVRPAELQPDVLVHRHVLGLPPVRRRRARTSCGPRAPRRCASCSARSASRPRRSTATISAWNLVSSSSAWARSAPTAPCTGHDDQRVPRVADLGRRELDADGHRRHADHAFGH